MQIKAVVQVDRAEDIGRPRWERNRCMPEGRGLALTIRDLRLVFSEPAARWLLAMLAPVMAPEADPAGLREASADEWPSRRPIVGGPAVRIQVVVHVYHSGELGRPRWEGDELVVAIGHLLLRFSDPATRGLLRVLRGFLALDAGTEGQALRSAVYEQ